MKISICGYGWLGLPLALHIQQKGQQIIGTTRTAAKQHQLKQQDLDTVLYSLGDDITSSELQTLFDCDVLILNIAPGRKQLDATAFVKNMTDFIQQAKTAGTKKLLFISTTSVYGEQTGVITESSPLQPTTASGQCHQLIEQVVFDVFAQAGAVMRLAGLVGENRHPARYLAGKTDIANGQHVVNLVHQTDVINAINSLIQHHAFGDIYHLCSHDHPTRQAYYQWACDTLGLPPAQFEESNYAPKDQGKLIDAQQSCQKLGLELRYPSPFDMLN
ncbi:SDR family oxidoreductase [Neptunicella marina]|uniref:SDR family oxidoreductase n=1 Tax=Neptunicella marina TaxID=2125989 RepID=A0A8J6IPX9_9ALTE|nr:SDR family oxidoreductase [Neptunicella marina]MBC3764524.1 SDR family oxidoreductase [Neptunicella marina]